MEVDALPFQAFDNMFCVLCLVFSLTDVAFAVLLTSKRRTLVPIKFNLSIGSIMSWNVHRIPEIGNFSYKKSELRLGDHYFLYKIFQNYEMTVGMPAILLLSTRPQIQRCLSEE